MTHRLHEALLEGRQVSLNAISYFETRRGLLAVKALRQMQAFERLWRKLGIVMIDRLALDEASRLYADLRAKGQLIEDADLLIAAVSLRNDLALVTHNTSHFSRISGLQLVDWISP